MWNIRGWKNLTANNDPPLVAAREEFLSWLSEVPQPCQSSWKARLQSDLDHPHHSVQLELYLHHYFKSNKWDIDIEPDMPGSQNKADFRVTRSGEHIIVEAKTLMDAESDDQQTKRLRQIADNLTKKISKTIFIEPLSNLPSSLPAGKIVQEIESHAASQISEILEFDINDSHQDFPYSLKIVIFPNVLTENDFSGVQGIISSAQTLSTGLHIRHALEEKAGKYGPIDVPFMIAIYGKGTFPVRPEDEFDALFGEREWLVPNMGLGQVTVRRKLNGFFTSKNQDKYRYQHVSAVLFYRFKWLDNSHAHQIHIYHNPFALRFMKSDLFLNIPQLVPPLKWINGEPEV